MRGEVSGGESERRTMQSAQRAVQSVSSSGDACSELRLRCSSVHHRSQRWRLMRERAYCW